MICIWTGAFLFWGTAFGHGAFNYQVLDKFKNRNLVAGIIIFTTIILQVFYSVRQFFA
jgi:hypothetical protein